MKLPKRSTKAPVHLLFSHLHVADGNAVVDAVPHDLILHFLPAPKGLFHQDLVALVPGIIIRHTNKGQCREAHRQTEKTGKTSRGHIEYAMRKTRRRCSTNCPHVH